MDKTSRSPQTTSPWPFIKPKTCLYILAFYILASLLLYSFLFKPTSRESISEDLLSKTNITQEFPLKSDVDINVDEITKLSIQLKTNKILASRQTEQRLPMLVSLEVEELDDTYRKPVDLVCILDSSPKMTDDKIEFIRNTLRYLLTFLNDQDRLSIVISGEQASNLVPLTNATPENKATIISALSTLNLRGRGTLIRGFDVTHDILKQRETNNQVTGILLLSEELDNPENHDVLRWDCDKERKNVYLTATALSRDIFLMAGIDSQTSGNLFLIDKLNRLNETFAFIESMEVFKTSVAKNVELSIKTNESEDLLKGVEIIKAYGDKSVWNREDGMFITKSKNLVSGRRQSHLLELKIPSFPQGFPNSQTEVVVASCEVVLTLHNGSQITKKTDLKVMFVGDEAELDIEENNEEIMKQFSKIGAELMIEAERYECLGRPSEEKEEILKQFEEIVGDENEIERLRKESDAQESRTWLTSLARNHLKFFRRLEL